MRGKLGENDSIKYQGMQTLERYFADGKGTSKHADKMTPQKTEGKIYSDTTLHTYKRAWNDYCQSMQRDNFTVNGHRPRTMAEAKEYMPAYIENLKQRPGTKDGTTMSAWSVRTYFSGAAKVLGVSAKDYDLPPRRIEDITRSREVCLRDKHFSEAKNAELVNFCQSTGVRNHKELQQIRGTDLVNKGNGEYAIHVVGKGGRERDLPIVGNEFQVQSVVSRMKEAGTGYVWPNVSTAADIHSYRADYARQLYDKVARDPQTLDPSDRYCARGCMKGKWFDRQALMVVSEALGHSRENVVVEHYLYK